MTLDLTDDEVALLLKELNTLIDEDRLAEKMKRFLLAGALLLAAATLGPITRFVF